MIPTATAVATKSAIDDLREDNRARRAVEWFAANAERITTQQIEICQIPAPPFEEAARAEFLRKKFVEFGFEQTRIDAAGNCLALRPGKNLLNAAVVSAHLDTVFPAGTDCTVRRDAGKLFAPGIMDDGCGLAALMALAEALQTFGFATESSILFVGTVGEEAAGNLRGVRHLFEAGEYKNIINSFISLDGAGVAQIVHRALGSRRYSVEVTGVGGHSWNDFGAPNPLHAVGRAVSALAAYPAPQTPRTTFNVGTIAGGTSVNAIPTKATMEVDLRSESSDELKRLDAFFRRTIAEAVAVENARRNQSFPKLNLNLTLTGERPGGETPETCALVQTAIAATRAVGVEPQLTISSTDSNLAMSLGVPAITLGAGGSGDKMHTLEEWYDPAGREIGLERALLLILALAENNSPFD